jgi:hypothetical protein
MRRPGEPDRRAAGIRSGTPRTVERPNYTKAAAA